MLRPFRNADRGALARGLATATHHHLNGPPLRRVDYNRPEAGSRPLDPRKVSQIGRFKVLDRLATGGMAEVFLAVDVQVDATRPLVVKRILPNLAQDSTFIRMFLQEARIALSVQHPNVVRLHKLGEHEGLPYLVMEYINGLTFRELERQAHSQGMLMPPGVVLDLIGQSCLGAHAVHETVVGAHREIVHRDLCPHNLMVDEDGVVKLLDFGIAKAAMGMDTTRTGVLKGKTAYLPPEQLRRGPVDRRADLWTLAVVAWELLAQRRMFKDLGEYDTMQAISNGRVPYLHDITPSIPKAICDSIHQCLDVDRTHRPATALEMRRTILDAAHTAGVEVQAHQTRTFVHEVLGLDENQGHEETTAAANIVLTTERFTEQIAAADALAALPDVPNLPAPQTGAPMVAVFGGVFSVLAMMLFVGGAIVGAFLLGPTRPSGPAIRLTFAPEMPPTEMVAELEPLRKDLEKALNRPVIFQVAASYQAAGKLLAEGHTDFALLPPYLYLDTSLRTPGVQVLVFSEVDSNTDTQGVLIAHKDFPYAGPDSIREHTVCLTDTHSTTGYMLPRAWFRRHGIDPDADFANVVMSGNHHQVIRDVASGRCDVGATFSAAMHSAYDVDVPVDQTRQIAATGATPNDALCMGPTTDAVLSAQVRDALLAWDPTVHGGSYVGAHLHLTGFNPGDQTAYDGLRQALELEVKP